MTDSRNERIVPVKKPSGPTSHDVVAIARRALGTRRIGHTGTLDPFASGLLLLCVGRATRLAEYVTALPKTYDAVARLDAFTDTGDHTGTPTQTFSSWRAIDLPRIEALLNSMIGEQLQRPPDYSARRVAGRRAYEVAREGKTPELLPTPIHIYHLHPLDWSPPDLAFRVECSSGTYVRALARDIGVALGTGGHLTRLERIRIGAIDVSRALTPTQLSQPGAVDEAALHPREVLPHLAAIVLSDDEARRVRHGQSVARAAPKGDVLLLEGDELLAVAFSDGIALRPRKVLLPE